MGSLIQRKGLDLLLPALAETSEDIHLTIVGEGQERELLTELMYSGTYGTVAGMVERSLKELQADGGTITTGTKWRYMWRRLFPDMGFYKEYVPVVYHHKILLPFYTVFRWGRGLIKNRKKITEEIKAIRKK